MATAVLLTVELSQLEQELLGLNIADKTETTVNRTHAQDIHQESSQAESESMPTFEETIRFQNELASRNRFRTPEPEDTDMDFQISDAPRKDSGFEMHSESAPWWVTSTPQYISRKFAASRFNTPEPAEEQEIQRPPASRASKFRNMCSCTAKTINKRDKYKTPEPKNQHEGVRTPSAPKVNRNLHRRFRSTSTYFGDLLT